MQQQGVHDQHQRKHHKQSQQDGEGNKPRTDKKAHRRPKYVEMHAAQELYQHSRCLQRRPWLVEEERKQRRK